MTHDTLRPPDFLLIGKRETELSPGWLQDVLDPGPSATAPRPSLAERLRAWLWELPFATVRLSPAAR